MAVVGELLVKIGADNSELQAATVETEKAFTKFANAAKQGTAALQSSIQTTIAAGRESGTLTQTLKQLEKAALAVPHGTAEWKMLVHEAGALKDEIMDTRAQVDFFADDFGKIKGLIGIGEGIAAGFSMAQGAAGLFGADTEKVQQSLLKVQSAMAVMNGLQKVQELLNKDSATAIMLNTAAQKAYTLAVGTSSGALKIFRLALISTGIGVIVVAIGLMIANWDKLKDAVMQNTEAFKKVKAVLAVIAPPLFLIIKAVEWLRDNWEKVLDVLAKVGLADDKQTREAKKNVEQRIVGITAEREAVTKKFDFEITKANAAGKNTQKLEEEKRRAILETLKVEALALIQRDKLNGTFTEETRTRLKEINEEIIKLGQERVIAEIKQNKESAENYKKTQDERLQKTKEINALIAADREDMELRLISEGKKAAESYGENFKAGFKQTDFSNLMEEEIIDEPELDALLERTKTKMQDVAAFSAQVGQQMTQLVQQSIGDAITNFATMLGTVAMEGGGAMQNFGKAFLGVIINFLQGFAKLLIAAGAAKVAFEKLAISGFGAIAAGAALMIATTAVKSHLSKGVPALAQGGLAFGPTLALVGDNRGASSNPEVIAPLDKLQSMMGGGGGDGGRVEFVIAGDNLKGVLSRNDKYRNRVS